MREIHVATAAEALADAEEVGGALEGRASVESLTQVWRGGVVGIHKGMGIRIRAETILVTRVVQSMQCFVEHHVASC